MERVVIVGTGPAGLSAAHELRRQGFTGELVMMGAEPHRPYRRPPLSKGFLASGGAETTLPVAEDLDARWLLGHHAEALDLRTRVVSVRNRAPVRFDGLVIATGVTARPWTSGPSLPGVMTLRTVDDAVALRAAIGARPSVVVAGSGFLGSELAATLRGLDLDVTVVERDDVPLRRPLGATLGARIADLHRRHDVDVRLGRSVVSVEGRGRLEQVRLDDGATLPAELLIVATGAVPATSWLIGSGLRLDDGVVVGADGLAAPGVAAAGDIARRPHPRRPGELFRTEHHNDAVEQGVHAARALLGDGVASDAVPSFWADLYGWRLRSIGFTGAAYDVAVVAEKPDGRFLAEYRDDGRLVGAVTAGFIRELPRYRHRLLQEAAS